MHGTRNGYPYSTRCQACAPRPSTETPPTFEDATAAVAALKSLRIRGFPKNDIGQRLIADYLQKAARSRSDLQGITSAIITGMTEWQGIAGLRLLIENYRARRAAEADTREVDRKLLEWRRDQKMLTGNDEPLPFRLPPAREFPPPPKKAQNGE